MWLRIKFYMPISDRLFSFFFFLKLFLTSYAYINRVLWNQFSDDLVNVSMHDEINSDTVKLARYNEPLYNQILGIRMIFFTPVIV